MQALRRARSLARFVLAWFVLTVGVAMASPVFQPQGFELVCSGAGVMKLVAKSEGGQVQPATPSLDCPLCAHMLTPLPAAGPLVMAPHPLSDALQPAVAAHIAWLTAAPLPARGPPSLA